MNGWRKKNECEMRWGKKRGPFRNDIEKVQIKGIVQHASGGSHTFSLCLKRLWKYLFTFFFLSSTALTEYHSLFQRVSSTPSFFLLLLSKLCFNLIRIYKSKLTIQDCHVELYLSYCSTINPLITWQLVS